MGHRWAKWHDIVQFSAEIRDEGLFVMPLVLTVVRPGLCKDYFTLEKVTALKDRLRT